MIPIHTEKRLDDFLIENPIRRLPPAPQRLHRMKNCLSWK